MTINNLKVMSRKNCCCYNTFYINLKKKSFYQEKSQKCLADNFCFLCVSFQPMCFDLVTCNLKNILEKKVSVYTKQ